MASAKRLSPLDAAFLYFEKPPLLAWLVIAALLLLVAYVGVDLAGRRWRGARGRG